MYKFILTTIAGISSLGCMAQGSSKPIVEYTLRVDSADLSGFDVEMRLKNMPSTFRLAMVAHPEYDDRYWHYVEGLRVETTTGKGHIVREDSALWRVSIPSKQALVRYRIHLPDPEQGQRAAWRPFLSPTGGLTGGPHAFMYIEGSTKLVSIIKLEIPSNWQIMTGLERSTNPHIFHASSVFELVDCPLLIGSFKKWSFAVDGVPHHVVYWLLPDAKPIDTMMLVNAIRKIVEQARAVFGKLPYSEYSFLIQDGAYGALEHANSVTLGIPTSGLAGNFADHLNDIVHEYFHTWNLVRIKPIEYGDVGFIKQPLSKGLWFSEGFTMFYADLLALRAGLLMNDSTRLKHLERLIRRYFNSPGNRQLSPEKVSLAEYGPPGMLGDYTGSSHLQGELIATLLDLLIRDASNGKRSLDDLMREMMKRYSGKKGFTSKDIETLVSSISGNDCVEFFRDHVYGNTPLDINKYIRLMGLEYELRWRDAINGQGKPAADLRIFPLETDTKNEVRIAITDPASCWGKAGLHTGDLLTAMNGITLHKNDDFWRLVRNVKLGDTVNLQVKRKKGPWQVSVIVGTFKQPVVNIRPIADVTEKQELLRRNWEAGRR